MQLSATAKKAFWVVLVILPGLMAWKVVHNIRAANDIVKQKSVTLLRATGMDVPDPNQKGNPNLAL